MFGTLIKKYDELIVVADVIPMDMLVNCLREFRKERELMCIELLSTNQLNIYDESKRKVEDFIIKSQSESDDNKDFFSQISNIRKEIQDKTTKDFLIFYEQGLRTIDDKEERLSLTLKLRMLRNPIYLGAIRDKKGQLNKICWFPFRVSPIDNKIYLLTQDALMPSIFHKSGYTVVEDPEEFGCAEMACGWSRSDLRQELNTWLFDKIFSDEDKELIVETKRVVNKGDSVLGHDISSDFLFLLSKAEFESLDYFMKWCPPSKHYDEYWLAEMESRAWDDSDEFPKIYTVTCNFGELSKRQANKAALVRPSICLNLDKFIKKYY